MVLLRTIPFFAIRQPLTTTINRNCANLINKDNQPVENDDEYILEEEADVQKTIQTDKSRLSANHKRMVHGLIPYVQPVFESHNTILHKKKMFGRYGNESGINPGTLWPSKTEFEATLAYEKIAHPFSIQTLVKKALEDHMKEEEIIRQRQQKIINNLLKLNQWKKDVNDRKVKKLADIAAAKAKKDALIEEVRRHFGYKIDAKDERFKEMLIQKERDQKKKLKEQKVKAKEERLYAQIIKGGA